MKWSQGAQWAVFGVAVAWGVMLGLTVAAGLGVGPWPSLERFVMLIAGIGAVAVMQHRRDAPLVQAFRFGVSTERRRTLTAVRDAPDDVDVVVDEVVATVHSLHQIR